MIALDYTTRIDPAALKAAGVTDVCRYLSWPYYWAGQTHSYLNPKIIQQAEFDELAAAGIGVTLNWEYDGRDWMSGADGGAAHAAEAVRQAKALGYPAGCAIPGSADFDMTRAQWLSAGRAYGAAYRDGIRAGGYREGVYGSWDVLAWCADELGYRMFWQSMSTAYSGGRNAKAWPFAHLWQRGYKTVGGVTGDRNDILIPDWGQHKGADMTPDEHRLLVNIERATTATLINGQRQVGGLDYQPGEYSPDQPVREASIVVQVEDMRAKLDGLAAAGRLSEEDRAAIAADLRAGLPTAADIAAAIIAQLQR